MTKILTLTGWQQSDATLVSLAPRASVFAYKDLTPDATVAALAKYGENVDLAIGWSLGGQILLDAVARKLLFPKQLLLLAAPVQLMTSPEFPYGQPQEICLSLKQRFRDEPLRAYKEFQMLIGQGDTHARHVIKSLQRDASLWPQGEIWLDWMMQTSLVSSDVSHAPPIIIVHGKEDRVIPPAQACFLAERLPQTELHLLEGCGHAPHLHDPSLIAALIKRYV